MTYEITERRDGMETKMSGDADKVREALVKVMSSGSRQHFLEIKRNGKTCSTVFDSDKKLVPILNNEGFVIDHKEVDVEVSEFSITKIRKEKLEGKLAKEQIEKLAKDMATRMCLAVA